MTRKIARTYSSERMTTRRERIIRIARTILAEGGPEALTISRLSEEANVAPSTIYRGFESKEGVILATIVDHMEGIRDYLTRTPTRGRLDAIFSEYDWIVAELFRDPEFARVVIDFYFSSDARPEARQALRSVAEMRVRHWLARTAGDGGLVPGLSLERIIEFQVDAEYATLHKWARRLIDRQTLPDELKLNFLFVAMACTTGRVRDEIIEKVREMNESMGDPPIRKAMVSAGL